MTIRKRNEEKRDMNRRDSTNWRGFMLLGAVERRGAFVVGMRDDIVVAVV